MMKAGVCYFILRNIFQYHLLDQFLLTSILTQELIIYELKTGDSNLLSTACIYRSPNSTVNNLDNLNVLLKNSSDKYNANLIVLVVSTSPELTGFIIIQILV